MAKNTKQKRAAKIFQLLPEKKARISLLLVVALFASSSVAAAAMYASSRTSNSANPPRTPSALRNLQPPDATRTASRSTDSESDLQTSQNRTSKENSTAESAPYKPSICTKTVIPYKTVYRDAAWLYVGDSRVDIQGRNGYKETCTADSRGVKPSDYTFDAVDTVVLVGTRQQASQNPSPTKTYEDAAAYCRGIVSGSSSAWDLCINAYLSK